jgi:hypothetical protein
VSAQPSPQGMATPLDLEQRPASPRASCARCGAPIPLTPRGVPRRDARYCSPACRAAVSREARAAARDDIATAMNLIDRALRRLGIHPARPRRRPKEHA